MVRAGLDVLRPEVARANRETGADEGEIQGDETGGDGRIRNRSVNNLLGLVNAVFNGMRFHIIPRGGRLKGRKNEGSTRSPRSIMKPTLLPCYLRTSAKKILERCKLDVHPVVITLATEGNRADAFPSLPKMTT